MKVLLFAGSLRKLSLNKQFVYAMDALIHEHNTQVIDLKTLDIPVYDQDVEDAGFPHGVHQLAQALTEADAVIISSPEYNGSISSPLKNVVDWISRLKPHPWANKPILLVGASPGNFGTIRALNHARTPFMNLGAFVFPKVFALSQADKKLEQGQITDPKIKDNIVDLLHSFLDYAQKLTKT